MKSFKPRNPWIFLSRDKDKLVWAGPKMSHLSIRDPRQESGQPANLIACTGGSVVVHMMIKNASVHPEVH